MRTRVIPVWWEHLLHALTGHTRGHGALPDLRDLESRRVAVQRTQFLANDRERQSQDDRLYVLRRRPKSRRDPRTVAVYSNGRNVGYLGDDDASALAPSLDLLGGAAIVNGAGSRRGSIRLSVDVPVDAALRTFVRHRRG